MKWVEQRYDLYAYVDDDGLIHGSVRKGYRAWHAHCGHSLGAYIDKESAQRAVERAARRTTDVG